MQKTRTMIVLVLILALSALACNLPFMAAKPAGTPAPTDSGFQSVTQPAETAVSPAGETPAAGEPAPAETAPAEPEQPGVGAPGGDKEITIATTDSLKRSGLLDKLIQGFLSQNKVEIKLETGGAGRAFRLGEKFVADVLLVNAPDDEIAYMDAGHGKERTLVFHTDYVIVGPADDPAGIKGAAEAVDAFKKIAGASAKFVTRDADVDVIRLEKDLWRQAGITPTGSWYIAATDSATAGVLKLASDKKAYTLTDRLTYLQNKANLKLEIIYEGDVELFDAYHVITHDPAKSPKINDAASQAFLQYLLSPEAQQMIAQFGVDTYGQPVYFADAGKPE